MGDVQYYSQYRKTKKSYKLGDKTLKFAQNTPHFPRYALPLLLSK